MACQSSRNRDQTGARFIKHVPICIASSRSVSTSKKRLNLFTHRLTDEYFVAFVAAIICVMTVKMWFLLRRLSNLGKGTVETELINAIPGVKGLTLDDRRDKRSIQAQKAIVYIVCEWNIFEEPYNCRNDLIRFILRLLPKILI